VWKIGDVLAVEHAVRGVVHRLVEGMGADADGGPSQVELAHVDGVERGVPGVPPHGQDVRFGDGVIIQGVLGHEILRGDHVLHQLVPTVLGADREEDVIFGSFHLAEGRDQRRLVTIADIVFASVGAVLPSPQRLQGHLGRV
jgi:hypothetical protein